MTDQTPNYEELAGFPGEATDEETALTSGQLLTQEVPPNIFYESPSDEGPTVDAAHRTPPQGPAVGSEFAPIIQTDQLKKVQRERAKIIQQREADKKPNFFDTAYNVAVPDPGTGQPVQVSGRHPNRKVLIISNTGTNPCWFAKTSTFATVNPTAANLSGNGFTIAAGGVMTIESQDTVYVYALAAAPTTVDIYEELFETASFE